MRAKTQEVVGLIPAGCRAFFSLYPSVVRTSSGPQGSATLLISLFKKWMHRFADWGGTGLIRGVLKKLGSYIIQFKVARSCAG